MICVKKIWGLVAFVFFLGLPSCRPDKRVDIYRPTGVVFRHGHDLVTASAKNPLNLDLQDILDSSAAGPSQLTVDTHCSNEYGDYDRRITGPPKGITVLNLLPTELQPFGPSQMRGLVCNFAVILMNSVGSTFHNPEFSQRIIVDNQNPQVFIDKWPDTYTKGGWVDYLTTSLKMTWSKPDGHQLKLACDEFGSEELILEKEFNLNDFAKALSDPLVSNKLELRPRQSCRVFETADAQIHAMSKSFDVVHPWQELKRRTIPLPLREPQAFDDIDRGTPLPIYDFIVTNPQKISRFIRIGRAPTEIHFSAYGTYRDVNEFTPRLYQSYPRWASIAVSPESDSASILPELNRHDTFKYYEIAPGAEIRLRLLIARHSSQSLSEGCLSDGHAVYLHGLYVFPVNGLGIELLDAAGQYQHFGMRDYEPRFIPRDSNKMNVENLKAVYWDRGPVYLTETCPD